MQLQHEDERGWQHELAALPTDGRYWETLWNCALRMAIAENGSVRISPEIQAIAIRVPHSTRLRLRNCGQVRALVTAGGIRFTLDPARTEFVCEGDQLDLSGAVAVQLDPVRDSGPASCILVTENGEVVADDGVVADAPADPPYYWGYDRRYRLAYAEGGTVWETLEPNEVVTRLVPALIRDRQAQAIIDLGCGEGRDCRWLAQQGYRATGVDVSPAALDRARQLCRHLPSPPAFLERDVIRLHGIAPESFDLALNMGCLHMLDVDADRMAHLRRVYEILKPGGVLLLDHCRVDWLKGFWSVEDYDSVRHAVPGDCIPRRIRTADGRIRSVQMPVLRHKVQGPAALVGELAAAGFVGTEVAEESGEAFGNSVVVICRKPGP